MADIRKRVSAKGDTSYQVRFANKTSKTGYAYKSFSTMKRARAFREDSRKRAEENQTHSSFTTVPEAVDEWLRICEQEGTNDREPVTNYTLQGYSYHARYMKAYSWPKPLQQLTTPDIVNFRSWLINNCPSRYTARKTLTYFHGCIMEMVLRGHMATNIASGVSVSMKSRYAEPPSIPSHADIAALLAAANRLANSKHPQIAEAWKKYRPMLYLAVDSGMRPQEYLALSKSALKENGIYVDRAIEGDGRSISVTKTPAGRRLIEISPETLAMVRDYAENHTIDNDDDLVFPATSGKWQCKSNWRSRGFRVACIEAGLFTSEIVNGKEIKKPKYKPYDLRHYFASALIENKVNPKKLQQMMGHQDIKLTFSVYGHLLDAAEDDLPVHPGIISQLPPSSCGGFVANMLEAAE